MSRVRTTARRVSGGSPVRHDSTAGALLATPDGEEAPSLWHTRVYAEIVLHLMRDVAKPGPGALIWEGRHRLDLSRITDEQAAAAVDRLLASGYGYLLQSLYLCPGGSTYGEEDLLDECSRLTGEEVTAVLGDLLGSGMDGEEGHPPGYRGALEELVEGLAYNLALAYALTMGEQDIARAQGLIAVRALGLGLEVLHTQVSDTLPGTEQDLPQRSQLTALVGAVQTAAPPDMVRGLHAA